MSPSRTPARALALAAPLLAALTAVVAPSAHAALGTAVEYYHPVLRHYFMTAYPDEAAMLDGGRSSRAGSAPAASSRSTPIRRRTACRCAASTAPRARPADPLLHGEPGRVRMGQDAAQMEVRGDRLLHPRAGRGRCPFATTPVYRSFFSDQISDVNHRFSVDLTVAARQPLKAGWVSEGIVMCSPLSDADLHADAVRLLEQGALGPTEASVLEVKAKGPAQWIHEQLGLNVTRYTQYPFWIRRMDPECIDDMTPPVTPEKYCGRTNGSRRRSQWSSSASRNCARPIASSHGACLAPDLRDQPLARRGVCPCRVPATAARSRVRHVREPLLKYALSPQLGCSRTGSRTFPSATESGRTRISRANSCSSSPSA